MDPAKWKNIKNILSATLDLPESERGVFLLAQTDADIRREVEKLLAAHAKSESLFNKPFIAEYGLDADNREESFIGRQIDDYLILEKIGEGGMGAVFLAEHRGEDFSQKVAVKLIKRGMDTNAVLKRFLMERQILAQLDHPFIARLLDGGTTEDGLPYFVMEYVEGESIRKFCDRHAFDTNERLELFRKVCAAVAYAHQKLVVHRDLKPSNIIVTADGTPKLLDFGIAKLLAPEWNSSTTEATVTNLRLMTPEYASPEQLRGKMTSVSTDVYSLGVVLYELLTGARPFDFKSKNALAAAEEILTREPLHPSSVVRRPPSVGKRSTSGNKQQKTTNSGQRTKSLKGDLDNIILKAIRKQPEERYASVQEFAEDIRRHLSGLPVTATADSTFYRFSKFVTRHRRAALTTAFVSLIVFALTGLSIYQGLAAMRERDKANARFEKLRDVAKLLMTDTRAALINIPGTIQVQKTLAEKSVALLDSLYDEQTTDAEFLSELAQSYEKLCFTQRDHLRDFAGARRSCEKAVALRRRVVVFEPSNVLRKSELIASLGEISQIADKRSESLRHHAEIEAIYREAVAQDPSEKRAADLALHLIGMAEIYRSWEMRGAEEAARGEGSRILQNLIENAAGRELTPAEKTELAWRLMWQAEATRDVDGDEKAMQNYRRAADISESAYRADNSLFFAFNHTSRAHRMMGEIYEKRGDFQKAFEMYKFSFDWLKTRENDSSFNKANLYYGLFFYANRSALMLTRLGRRADADALIVKPLEDYWAFLDLEENASSLLYAREPFADLARYFSKTNRREEAAAVWERYNKRLQKFLDKNPDDFNFLNNQVEAQDRLGEIYAAYDPQADSFDTNDVALLRKARSHYEKAAALYRHSQALYEPTQAEKAALQKIERKIEKLKNF